MALFQVNKGLPTSNWLDIIKEWRMAKIGGNSFLSFLERMRKADYFIGDENPTSQRNIGLWAVTKAFNDHDSNSLFLKIASVGRLADNICFFPEKLASGTYLPYERHILHPADKLFTNGIIHTSSDLSISDPQCVHIESVRNGDYIFFKDGKEREIKADIRNFNFELTALPKPEILMSDPVYQRVFSKRFSNGFCVKGCGKK